MQRFLKVGDIIETRIDTVAFGGDGVARINNMVAFVPFTVNGDMVEVEIAEVKKKYLRGKVRKILAPSPQRVEPKCLYFSKCGGCQYQHILYEYQLEIKKRQVVESFERIGRLRLPPVKKIIPSPEVFGYRGKLNIISVLARGSPPRLDLWIQGEVGWLILKDVRSWMKPLTGHFRISGKN